MADGQWDYRALDDRQCSGMLGPHPLVDEPRVQLIPCGGRRRSVPAGDRARGGRGCGPAAQVGEPELRAVPGWRREARHAVPAHSAQDPPRKVGEGDRQPRQVETSVEDQEDVRVTVAVLPGRSQTLDHAAHLSCGDECFIVVRLQADCVEHRRPRGATRLERGDERVLPAGDQLRPSRAAPVHVAERTLWARRASGRGQALTSTANTIAPSRSRGIDSAAIMFRRRSMSNPPRPSYRAP